MLLFYWTDIEIQRQRRHLRNTETVKEPETDITYIDIYKDGDSDVTETGTSEKETGTDKGRSRYRDRII